LVTAIAAMQISSGLERGSSTNSTVASCRSGRHSKELKQHRTHVFLTSSVALGH